jgi:hypothetical protein
MNRVWERCPEGYSASQRQPCLESVHPGGVTEWSAQGIGDEARFKAIVALPTNQQDGKAGHTSTT